MIGIVDYKLGNVKAFANIYKQLGIPHRLAAAPEDLAGVSRIILPGVGAFDHAMSRLEASGMREALLDAVLRKGTPVLGVCVGMQMLTARSEEGVKQGLGWIDGEVLNFRQAPGRAPIHIPHMGWNDVEPVSDSGLFKGLGGSHRFYFLHSYYARCESAGDVLGQTVYGAGFACAIGRGNVCGVQFHPEKSHRAGIQLLKNFAEM
jgi:glutamine amidotransferase